MIKPLTIFRTEINKQPAPEYRGLIECARVVPLASDAVKAADADIESRFRWLAPEKRAIYTQHPFGYGISLPSDPLAVLAGNGWRAWEAEAWLFAYYSRLKNQGMLPAVVITDVESVFPGLSVWDQIGHADHCRTLMASKEFHRVAPFAVKKFTADDYASLWNMHDARTREIYSTWQDWTAHLINKAIRSSLLDTFRDCSPAPVVMGNYGAVGRSTPDGNGWPMPCGTFAGWSMVDCYPWDGIAVRDCPGGPEWGSILYGINHVRSQQDYPAMPYFAYAAWDQDRDEHTGRRPMAIWKNIQLWRHLFRMYDRAVYWEGPPVDTESDQIIADEIARADAEITRRDHTLPYPLPPSAESIITLDHATCRQGIAGFTSENPAA